MTKIERPAEKAADVCRHCDLGKQARTLLQERMSPEAYLIALQGHALYRDALVFLAHWLPKRGAVWWGCQAAWHLERTSPSTGAESALRAAVAWVVEPSEPNRRQCGAAGSTAGIDTLAGALALAAFCSEGSLSAPSLPMAPPDGFATSQIIAAALVATAAEGAPEQAAFRCRLFLSLGLDVAHGKNLWI